MNRIARAAALSLLAAVALSGCVRYTVDLTLETDNTASGTVVTAIQSGIGEQLGAESDQAALNDLFAGSPFDVDSGTFTASDYAEDGYIGKQYAFDGLGIDQFGAFADLFSIERVGDEFIVSSESAPTPDSGVDQMPPGAEASLSITFPGEVVDHNGTLEDKTVTWNLFTQNEPISATAGATSDGRFPVWLVIAAAVILAVLIGVAIVVVVVLGKQKGAPPLTMPGDSTDSAVPAPPVQPMQNLAVPPAASAPPPPPPPPPAPPTASAPPPPSAEPEDTQK